MVFEFLDQDLRKFLDREQQLDIPVIKVSVWMDYQSSVIYVPNVIRTSGVSSLSHFAQVDKIIQV